MAITKNAGGGFGNRINEPGEYKVKVQKIETGMSKKQKPMLTVTFETEDEKEIRAWFVKSLNFHMKNLSQLKLACGLKPESAADELVGKECGILVEAQEPREDGTVFMHIAGYGKSSEVDEKFRRHPREATNQESVPF